MAGTIDPELARRQHGAYCRALEEAGISIISLPPDESFPDCCFVEDTSVIAGGLAVIAYMGAVSRRGEEAAVRNVLRHRMPVRDIIPPATLDGGDALVIGRRVYVGIGDRTNEAGVEQVRELAGPGLDVIPVTLEGVLHLKSACTYMGEGRLLLRPGHLDADIFSEYRIIEVPAEEAYAANCLALGSRVIVSKGYPRTKAAVEAEGFETLELDMSEFRKGHGSLTCLSKIIP
jgi:dimethylargininase